MVQNPQNRWFNTEIMNILIYRSNLNKFYEVFSSKTEILSFSPNLQWIIKLNCERLIWYFWSSQTLLKRLVRAIFDDLQRKFVGLEKPSIFEVIFWRFRRPKAGQNCRNQCLTTSWTLGNYFFWEVEPFPRIFSYFQMT